MEVCIELCTEPAFDLLVVLAKESVLWALIQAHHANYQVCARLVQPGSQCAASCAYILIIEPDVWWILRVGIQKLLGFYRDSFEMSENTSASAFCVFMNVFSELRSSLTDGTETTAPLLSTSSWLPGLGLSGWVNGCERNKSGWGFAWLDFLLAKPANTLAEVYGPSEHIGGKHKWFHADLQVKSQPGEQLCWEGVI